MLAVTKMADLKIFSSNQVKFKDLTVMANFYSNLFMCNQLGRIDDFDKFFHFY